MPNITILSGFPGKLASAVNKAFAEGLSKSVPHFAATPCGSALSLVLTEEPGRNRDASGSIHEVQVISGTREQVQAALSGLDNPYAKVIGFASHAAPAKKQAAPAEGQEAKKQAKPAKESAIRFHALVATLQP